MPGPILYSTNPWFAHDIAVRYLNGVHFAWVSDHFDATALARGTAGGATAPSSSPCEIYTRLAQDVVGEDTHSFLINGYKKTFKRLARAWEAAGAISSTDSAEIVALLRSHSWHMWRPVLYVIPRSAIHPARIHAVARAARAAYGPENQILDLQPHEFDVIEFKR